MPKPKTSDKNIWKNAFKSGSDIEGTSLKNGVQSKIAVSSINTSGRATIAYSLTAAIVAMIQGRVSVGRTTASTIWCECKSGHIADRRYVMNYDPMANTLHAFAAESKNSVQVNIANDTYSHWSVFVPRIAEIILNDPQGEFASAYKEVLQQYQANGMISKSNELFVLNDYLYESKHEYIQDYDEIEIVTPSNPTLKDDISDLFGCPKGQFEFGTFATAASQTPKTPRNPTSKASGGSSSVTGHELDWERELTPEELAIIPKYDLTVMKITKELAGLVEMVKEEHDTEFPVNNVILYGEAGAGKSTAAKLSAQSWGIPYRFINLSLNSEESDMIGSYRPKADGTFEFFEPAFAQTFRNGGVIELMEINYARPGAMGVLNSALDDTAMITLGNGEVIKRHPNCIIIATTNVDYAGCQKMNEALKDRFQDMILIEKLPNADLIDIAMRQSGNNDKSLVGKMVDAVVKISIKMTEEQITGGVCSTRQLVNWARKSKYTPTPIESAKTTILPGVSLDLEIQKEIIDTILKPMF